jgi:hypothetical protein
VQELDMSKSVEKYEVVSETRDAPDPNATTNLGATTTDNDMGMGGALNMPSTQQLTMKSMDLGGTTMGTGALATQATGVGVGSDHGTGASKDSKKKDKGKTAEASLFLGTTFERAQLENFMALLLPFPLHDAATTGLLQISPFAASSPDQRVMVMHAITMPDVFLQHNLVPLLVPMCSGNNGDALTRWSCHTLYLMLLSFARPVPVCMAEEFEAAKAHERFRGVLNQFRIKCQLGDPVENIGGVQVLMDVLWKLFTRRKSYVDPEAHMDLRPETVSQMKADNYYHVPFVESVVEVLTDLCIGSDNRAVKVVQDVIAYEMMMTNESTAVRRRPEPECFENPWEAKTITVDARQAKLVGKKRGLAELFQAKDEFTLLRLGTIVFFDPHSRENEEAEGVKIPTVLWMQSRAQPTRFACGTYTDDVAQHVNDKISLQRFLYFTLVNLLAHLCADRHDVNSGMLREQVPHHVVKTQLIQQETLTNAGMRFVPPGRLQNSALASVNVEARDLGDLSDLLPYPLTQLCCYTPFSASCPSRTRRRAARS